MKFFNINLAKTKKGVSIIELLIVISVIGILASTVSVVSSGTQKSARDAKRKEDAELIMNALTAYAAKHGGSHKDITGTFNLSNPPTYGCNEPIAYRGFLPGDAIPDLCQASFYSTTTSTTPTGTGRNSWTVLEQYLSPYVGSSLPIDPKNSFNNWNNPFPNYASNNLRNGYYMVFIANPEISQTVCGWTKTLSYFFETAPEDQKDKLTNKQLFPSWSSSGTCTNQGTLITLTR